MERGDICLDCEKLRIPGSLCAKHAKTDDMESALERLRSVCWHNRLHAKEKNC